MDVFAIGYLSTNSTSICAWVATLEDEVTVYNAFLVP